MKTTIKIGYFRLAVHSLHIKGESWNFIMKTGFKNDR